MARFVLGRNGMTLCPNKNGRSGSGMATVPSARWCCSTSDRIRRGTAHAVAFSVCTNCRGADATAADPLDAVPAGAAAAPPALALALAGAGTYSMLKRRD